MKDYRFKISISGVTNDNFDFTVEKVSTILSVPQAEIESYIVRKTLFVESPLPLNTTRKPQDIHNQIAKEFPQQRVQSFFQPLEWTLCFTDGVAEKQC